MLSVPSLFHYSVLVLCWLTAAASSLGVGGRLRTDGGGGGGFGRRVRRDGAHHGGHHPHAVGPSGFHGFGSHYSHPLIIEEAGRFGGGRPSSSYGYKPPSQSYGPPPPAGPRPSIDTNYHGLGNGGSGNNGGDGGSGGIFDAGFCPAGCVPVADVRKPLIPEGSPSTHYGPPLPIYADFGPDFYPDNYVDEEQKETTKPTPKPVAPKPTKPVRPTPTPKPAETTTTPAPETRPTPAPGDGDGEAEEATLPPFIDSSVLGIARTFGFEIVPGNGEPPSQDELDEVLALLPPGLSFSLLPMNMQDAYFSGQIKLRKVGDREKRRTQLEMALDARKASSAASAAATANRNV